MIKVEIIKVSHLFPILNKRLLELMRGLSEERWYFKTACADWCVKDIFQHLLKDNLGVISRKRDEYKNPFKKQPSPNDNDLLTYINNKNQEWVEMSRSFSPKLLIELFEFVGDLVQKYYETVDLEKIEAEVSWASDGKLPNWVDVAREYTEQWLHQAHIREAVGAPLLTDRKLFHPFLQAYMLALPKTYQNVDSEVGTIIGIKVTGEAGGNWTLTRDVSDWELTEKVTENCLVNIEADQDIVWRLFSKGLDRDVAGSKIMISGDTVLGKKFLDTVSLIA